jgi:hypothetical protein
VIDLYFVDIPTSIVFTPCSYLSRIWSLTNNIVVSGVTFVIMDIYIERLHFIIANPNIFSTVSIPFCLVILIVIKDHNINANSLYIFFENKYSSNSD